MRTEKFSPLLDWKVLFVKPRCEKKVAEHCLRHNIDFYLPIKEQVRVVQRQRRKVTLPLFPGYVFAVFPRRDRTTILQSHMVARILEPQRSMDLARSLVMIRRALAIAPELTPEPVLAKGMKVKIIDGPFMGIEGVVEKSISKIRVVLNIEMIGQSVAVSAEAGQLEIME
jgi:transcription antitermination factor NusG